MNPRNKPCLCASGKKFKHCCGDNAKLAAQRHAEHEALRQKIRERNAVAAAKPKPKSHTSFGRRNTLMTLNMFALLAAFETGDTK